MAKGARTPAEAETFRDTRTGATVRRVTGHPSIHHHPFFFMPAYDDAMRRLVFVSHRTGSPQVFDPGDHLLVRPAQSHHFFVNRL